MKKQFAKFNRYNSFANLVRRSAEIGGCLLILFFLLSPSRFDLSAQNPPESGDDLPTTNRIIVTGEAVNRGGFEMPSSAVYATSKAIFDTPRGVTSIGTEEMDIFRVQSALVFSKFGPNSFTPNLFGIPSEPFVRGQRGEVFQNEVRTLTRNTGLPLDFNGVEGFDIVRGPAGPVYGTAQLVGGYVNLQTKKPFEDHFHATGSFTVGSYGSRQWQLDFGGPVPNSNLAFRVSYAGEDSDSFYKLASFKTESVFAALLWHPTDALRLEINGRFYVADFNEIAGWNRPTQELIDHGDYITGEGVNASGVPGFGSVIVPTGTVHLSRQNTLINPNDGAYGKDFVLQATTTLDGGNGFSWRNRTYFEHLERERISNIRYVEIVPDSWAFENRFECSYGQLSLPGVESVASSGNSNFAYTVGSAFRLEHFLGFQDFFNEAFNPYDLSKPPLTRLFPPDRYVNTLHISQSQFPVAPGGIYPNSGFFGSAGTNDTDTTQLGVFSTFEFRPIKQISVSVGGRLDALWVSTNDPAPPEGFTPARDTLWQILPNTTASITLLPSDFVRGYFTYSYLWSPSPDLGNGYSLVDNKLISERFQVANELLEGGARFRLPGHQLELAITGFQQSRSETDFLHNINEVRARGVELEMIGRVSDRLEANLGLSYTNIELLNFRGAVATPSVYDAFAPPLGTGIGSPNFAAVPVDDYEQPGIPPVTINVGARYRLAEGFEVWANTLITGPQNVDIFGRIEVPWQKTINVGVSYRFRHAEVRLNVSNLTNERNFSTYAGAFSGGDLVVPDYPLRTFVTFRYTY